LELEHQLGGWPLVQGINVMVFKIFVHKTFKKIMKIFDSNYINSNGKGTITLVFREPSIFSLFSSFFSQKFCETTIIFAPGKSIRDYKTANRFPLKRSVINNKKIHPSKCPSTFFRQTCTYTVDYKQTPQK
jgi:hypothetical protein